MKKKFVVLVKKQVGFGEFVFSMYSYGNEKEARKEYREKLKEARLKPTYRVLMATIVEDSGGY